MARQFREADREKRVLTADGQTVGSVSDVSADRATVARVDDEGQLTDEMERLLGWTVRDPPVIRRDQVNRHDDEAVHLVRLR